MHIHIIITLGTYSKDLSKMLYLQNRRYLNTKHKFRSDKNKFPDKAVEVRLIPRKRDYSEMKSLHEAYHLISEK